jgi:hypothetical protein
MPPNNGAFYHAAYTIVVVLYGGYALSVWLRSRRIRRRLAELDASSPAGRGGR